MTTSSSHRKLQWTSITSVMLFTLVTANSSTAADSVEFFEKQIRPLLIKHCYDCHGPDEPAGKLRLDVKDGWVRGGERGPAIVPGDPSSSLLMRLVTHRDPKLRMPPPDEGEPLNDAEIRDLTRWIRQGAADPRTGETVVTSIEQAARTHWAFQPLAPPAVQASAHPIDALISQVLNENEFTPVPTADTRTLIRRATFDLHGLPPTSEQTATPREDFPELINALLSSPRYGERWGRHWLDVARYSDAKDGVLMYGDKRIRPFAYTYRDYVIRAFNDDKPFDEFIREQIAADQLDLATDAPELAGMGLLTLGRMFDRNRHDVIDDQIDVISRGFLGLTMSCARCHDHKFDPIPTADYYSLYGVFASSIEPLKRPRIQPVTTEGNAYEDELRSKLQEIRKSRQSHYQRILATARERTPDYLVHVATTEPDVSETGIFFLSLIPNQLRPQITYRWRQLIARRTFPDDSVFGPWYDLMREPVLKVSEWKKRGVDPRVIERLASTRPTTPEQIARTYGEVLRDAWKQSRDASRNASTPGPDDDSLVNLLMSDESPVWFPENDIYHYLSRKDKDAFRGLVNQIDEISVKHKSAASRAMVMVDSETLYDPVIFQRGDPRQPGLPVPRQFLKQLDSKREPFTRGSGRLDLANAIASKNNPLTARVWVNRVWMHHFGTALVDDPSDFGLRTARPVQHRLLDFLAAELVRSDWKTKPLHRLIMTSQAWQRTSLIPNNGEMGQQLTRDPDNRLIWHANRRRLDLEQMRDTLLFVSGNLDETMFGRPPLITDANNNRRTVYAFVERQSVPDMVRTFDFANADTSTGRRVTTTVPQQALFAMNSPFVTRTTEALTARLADGSVTEKVEQLYEFVLGRSPSDSELELAASYIANASLKQFARVLLMSNELMFVD